MDFKLATMASYDDLYGPGKREYTKAMEEYIVNRIKAMYSTHYVQLVSWRNVSQFLVSGMLRRYNAKTNKICKIVLSFYVNVELISTDTL